LKVKMRRSPRQHRRDDVGIVDLATRKGIAAAQHHEPIPNQGAIFENRELSNEPCSIGDSLCEGERLSPDLLPSHHRKVFAQDLSADRRWAVGCRSRHSGARNDQAAATRQSPH
jgi:hypothetical protein